jgi:hypothetical protein
MKFLVMQFSVAPSYVLPRRFACSRTPSDYVLSFLRDRVSCSYKTTGKVIFFHSFFFVKERERNESLYSQCASSSMGLDMIWWVRMKRAACLIATKLTLPYESFAYTGIGRRG